MDRNTDQLILYYRPACPYCQKVLRHMTENNITLAMRNISEAPEMRDELIAIGGKGQVPCLVIDGKALYESDDIIFWLKNHLERK
ncbi:MAG TPA: glutathione S-transferase N-terminal domain-containing protein [Candidatus Omnitrophota bacterium]|nr:glutathione S-transferase N-terminal domain-containing protein [Candidatus Omnitrophota bacterium]